MPVLKRRSRIVSFRLSDEEYQVMMAGCISQGSRSLSEFARSAACDRGLGSKESIQGLKDRVEELDRMVRSLNVKVADTAGGNRESGEAESDRPIPVMASARRKDG